MSAYEIREAQREDLDALMAVEESCFATDRLSRRAMRQWLEKKHRIMLVASVDGAVAGYALIIHHQGTRLGRLYSIAVLESRRGLGLARALLSEGEKRAAQRGCIDLRLEVAHVNKRAIAIYQAAGYREFGLLQDYYEDHSDAVRMQKRILQPQASARLLPLVWLPQQMEFTCGPAALMMALQHLAPNYIPSLTEELRIWREANTVFMTSGPAGCHPIGLALAAERRGVKAEVWIRGRQPLFLDGVRSPLKKRIIAQVDSVFSQEAEEAGISVKTTPFGEKRIVQACDAGAVVLLLISTWRLENKKSPHWVTVTGYDDYCFYLHDPALGDNQLPVDCQHFPVARVDVDRMSRYGRSRTQTALVLSRKDVGHE